MSSKRIAPPEIPRGGSKGRVKARPPPIPRGAGMRQIEERAERKFQLRNEFDAMVEEAERNLERRRNVEFQERRHQTGLTSGQIAEARAIGRARSEDIRKINRKRFEIKKQLEDPVFTRRLMEEGVAGRKIGGGSIELANALFGGAGLEQVVSTHAIRHTAVKPQPAPEPEPAPELEPERGGVKGRPQPQKIKKTEVRGTPIEQLEPEPEPERYASGRR